MSYRTYENYITTPVEYIEKIPESWKLTRNKNLFIKNKNIVGQIWNKYPVLSLTKEGVKIKDIEKNEGKMPSDFGTYQIIEPGNLLLCLFDIDVTPRCVGYIKNKGIVSGAYAQIIPITDLNMKFYYYWYLMLDNTKELLHLSKNLRNSLSNENFMELYLVQPPLDEQEQIAKYLDHKTTKIEQTITKNKKLLELLKEKRTSLINQTVTKGLNPDTPMKESGIEWIGEIPEHWEVSKIKYFGNISMGQSPDSRYYTDDNKYMVFVQGNADLKKGKVIPRIYTKHITKKARKNDILLTVRAPCGDVATTEYPICIGRGVCAISNTKNNEFLLYYLTNLKNNKIWEILSNGSTFEAINSDDVNNMILIEPSIKEQNEIVEYLDKETQKIDKTIEKVEKNIELLEEYKESLIHHVVTGKIDVRGVEV